MEEKIIKARGEHPFGLRWLARMDGAHADMLMDFGVYRMKRGDVWEEAAPLEKAALLVYGEVKFEWAGQEHTEYRENCFDVPPTALHADRETAVRITCLSDEAELNLLRTDNERAFGAKLYLPADTPDEFRG
ncbi:MAG: 5-deoxy-glucuronate isomerase, partial [Clostridia bacterium]|nr:5-deoxy-glucuronate isomerase [Clostridia bacterium]